MSRAPEPRPRPRVSWIPKAHSNDAEDAIFLATGYDLAPDPWQSDILYGWLGRRADEKWCAGRCGLAVPRQNGKNGVIEIRELYGMLVLGEAFLHTAHEVKTARKAFKRLKHFFGEKANDPGSRFPDLNALVREVRNTNGQEAIFLHDVCTSCSTVVPKCQCDHRVVRRGGSIEFVARSNGSGRGYTVDVLVLDEAQHLADDELEAIRSSVSSAPLGNPQVIYTGTPPNRDKGEQGEVFTRVRYRVVNPENGERRAEPDKRTCWIEYSAPDGPLPDIDDRKLLHATNPALELRHANGAFGLTMDVVLDERGDLSDEGYARERFGWWGDPGTKHQGVINMQTWAALRVTAPPPTRAQLVVDVAGNLEWTSIALASAHRDDRSAKEWGGARDRVLVIVHHAPGTGWAVQKIVDLAASLNLIEVALTKNARIFSAKLTAAGVDHHDLTDAEVGRGCTAFQEMVRDTTVAHVAQAELDAAVRNARTRFVGTTQQWDGRDPRIDQTSLVATSVAAQRWALATAKPVVPAGVPRSEAMANAGGGIDISTVQW